MQQETLLQKVWTLGQALTLGSALILSPVSVASAATTVAAYEQGKSDSSSLSKALERDYSSDMQRASNELEIARSLLGVLSTNAEAAVVIYLDRLGDILDAAMRVSSERLPEYSRFLADSLRSGRAELHEGVDRPETWTRIAKIVAPGSRPVLPERFVARRVAKPLEISKTDLEVAEYLRSSKGPRLL